MFKDDLTKINKLLTSFDGALLGLCDGVVEGELDGALLGVLEGDLLGLVDGSGHESGSPSAEQVFGRVMMPNVCSLHSESSLQQNDNSAIDNALARPVAE